MGEKRMRLGIIGANTGYGWTPRAHAPALAELPKIELAAVCTAHEETARESADKFNVPLAFSDHNLARTAGITTFMAYTALVCKSRIV